MADVAGLSTGAYNPVIQKGDQDRKSPRGLERSGTCVHRGDGGLATILTGASPPDGGWVSGKAADLLVSNPNLNDGGCVGCGYPGYFNSRANEDATCEIVAK